MDFSLSSVQSQLQESARRMLEASLSNEQITRMERSEHGFPKEIWEEGVKLGWPGISLPETFGGSECSLLDTCILVEEFGRGGATLPFVTSSGVVAPMLQRLPEGACRDRLLADIAAGKIVCPAFIEARGRSERGAVRLPLTPDGAAHRLTGQKILVPFASFASEMIVTCAQPNGDLALVVVDPQAEGITLTRHQTNIGMPLFSVAFNETKIASENIISRGEDAIAAFDAGLKIGALLATAEAVGLCEALINMTAEYVTLRKAFGQPIGAFQAVAHPCADMRISTETIRLLVHEAAWKIDHGEDGAEEVASTKGLANELFERLANDAFRVHGAIAYSNEYDLQLYTRRLQWFCRSLGETQASYIRASAVRRAKRQESSI